MSSELYIEEQRVDLTDDVVFALNYWLADIRQPDKRNTNFSKTITIPGTATNNQIFTHIYQIGINSTFNPNIKADVLLVNGGARTFTGYCQLKNIIRQYAGAIKYEVTFFGDLGNIFTDMGESYLSSLSMTDLNHTRNTPNIQTSWSNTTGYVYPIINNGQIDVQTNYLTVNASNMRVCVYAKTIWDKIFDSYGYRYTSSFISGAVFTKLILPELGDTRLRTVTVSGTIVASLASVAGGVTHTVTLYINKVDNAGNSTVIYSEAKSSTASFFPTWTISQVFLLNSGDQLSIRMYWSSTDPAATCTVIDTSEWGAVYDDTTEAGYADGDFQAGKTGSQALASQNTVYTVTFEDENYDPYSSYSTSTYAHTVPYIQLLARMPKLKQRDFMMGMIRMFNLYLEPDPQDPKHITILPRDTFYQSGVTVDWSSKVDLSKEYDQAPMPFLDFKQHDFKYAQDTDFYNDLYTKTWGINYGDKEYIADTDFQTKVSTIELPFAATPSVKSSINTFVLPTIVKVNPADAVTGNVFANKPRILFYGGLISGDTWNLTDGINTITPSTYPFASHVDHPQVPTVDILFDTPKQVYWYIDPALYTNANLFNVYYSKFMQEITDPDSKLLTVDMYLTPHDVEIISFKNKFFLFDHEFRLNKINDFNPDSPGVTSVEFIKIIEGDEFTAGYKRPINNAHKFSPVWVSPKNGVYVFINGRHWKIGASVDDVLDPTEVDNPLAILSPKNSVW